MLRTCVLLSLALASTSLVVAAVDWSGFDEDEDYDPESVATNFTCPEPHGFFPNPDNCIKYYQCVEFDATPLTCHKGSDGRQLHYLHEEANPRCEWPESVDCGDRPICDHNDENCDDDVPGPIGCDHVECAGDDWYPQQECSQCTCVCHEVGELPEELCCQDGFYWHDTAVCKPLPCVPAPADDGWW